jgi:hypothetical protein
LGSGRCGTSLAAGVVANAGYFMGDQLYPPDAGNPRGYFEDPQVNAINEDLLAEVLPPRPSGLLGSLFFRSRPSEGQRWLAQVPLDRTISCPASLEERIRALTGHRPFCLKDPRFAYTLPAWRPLLGDAAFVCLFREPAATAASMLAECRRQPILRTLSMTRGQALATWQSSYTHILDRHVAAGGDWLFLHYNQFFTGEALPRLERFLGVKADHSFVDPGLRRSQAAGPIPAGVASLYERLCAMAEYQPSSGDVSLARTA